MVSAGDWLQGAQRGSHTAGVGQQGVTPLTPLPCSSVACEEQVWSTRICAGEAFECQGAKSCVGGGWCCASLDILASPTAVPQALPTLSWLLS